MNLPGTVSIGHYTYDIKQESPITQTNGPDLCGKIDYMHQDITVSWDMSENHQRETLMHELLHAVCYHHHVQLKEREVMLLARGISELLVRNPSLVDVYADQR